jgi:hypothetical protein
VVVGEWLGWVVDRVVVVNTGFPVKRAADVKQRERGRERERERERGVERGKRKEKERRCRDKSSVHKER